MGDFLSGALPLEALAAGWSAEALGNALTRLQSDFLAIGQGAFFKGPAGGDGTGAGIPDWCKLVVLDSLEAVCDGEHPLHTGPIRFTKEVN